MKKILLTYSTVDGHTKTICEKILSYSETSQVDILPIDSSINIKDYDTVVIGASIRYGKYREEIFEFIKENEELLNSKDNAFFSVNVVARKENKNKPETNPYLIKFLNKISWQPKILDVFAGKIDYPKYKFLDKYAIKFIMWITKGPTDTSKVYEFTDWNRVKSFAEKLEL
ncbi:MAG: menaquinone-dependent protoporphyrinogen IX dehydrogenase [Pseudomonadota bacterium]|jgi:menaquinone-dependent protoporphyrinogen oxidase|nr:menaquinone-dependent protoporphyrinogen IX dehydrogenase [Pseudomonadota bacterium]|tara:strand:- start:605 stop:1117 length:513 start_codon:yes stop_codon:yes gene_type:complete